MSEHLIAELANLALTLSLIVAIIFGIAQISVARRDRRERLTLETLREFQSKEFAETILFILNTQFPKDNAEWMAWPNECKTRFIQVSQQMESLGILLADKVIDLNLLDKTLGSFVVTTWEKYKPFMLKMRVHNNDPLLNEYFQWMAELIDKRMKANPRKPFFMTNGNNNIR